MGSLARMAVVACAGALAALAFAGSALAARGPAAAGTVYGGYSGQDSPMVVTLDRKRTSIKTVGFFVESPDYYLFGDTGRAVAIKPQRVQMGDHVVWGTRIAQNGSFKASGVAVTMYGDNPGAFEYTLRGRVKRGAMQGTLQGTLSLVDPATGQTIKTVPFPAVRWIAVSAPGRVFAGTTATRDPVVVELNRAGGNRATFVRIPWRASSDTSAWALSETLRGLKLAGGAYTAAWSEPYTRQDGGRNTFDYAFALRVTGFKAAGTIQVKVTETDAAGAVEGTCDSGVVSFRATSSSGKAAKSAPRVRSLSATSSSSKAGMSATNRRMQVK